MILYQEKKIKKFNNRYKNYFEIRRLKGEQI